MSDTIAAIATAPGQGAVGVVKLAGPNVESIARTLGLKLTPRLAHFASLTDAQGQTIDSGLSLYFPAPH